MTRAIDHPEGHPDWSSINERIACPLCDYELRGLTEPRCPECGREFTWSKLLDPTQRLHPYLFEHHRGRRAFVRTLIGGLNPWRFWRTLQPKQPSSMPRLFWYWILCALFTATVLIPPFIENMRDAILREYGVYDRFAKTMIVPIGAWLLPSVYREALRHPSYLTDETRFYLFIWLLWPWASAAVFLLLRTSMRSARVRFAHVLRVVVYSSDAVVWMAVISSLAYCWTLGKRFFEIRTPSEFEFDSFICVCWLLEAMILMRLTIACRKYLRLSHAIGIALASQILAVLIVLVVLLALGWDNDRLAEIMNNAARLLRLR